ncbi:tripartite tricarboxylate transporter substrate binding protein [Variovorax sp. YR216]|uniref:Bug family tripartite tricarboxylate transporter substrate binding protein n=1 Tax=Variovorax sp. YR216 TaxID=1882828 RepID=UPI000898E258|nr:tripartite tricarboxylate transporter substrate binding protein [Variovorax sp. YR216]SEB25589.1 Tripartite-type tricarboxylate transporter, receptor component TctC [Variovorax sp. YR216]
MLTRRQLIAASASLVPLGLTAPVRAAAPYPSKPVRFVVPAPAGSPVDTIARKLGDAVARDLGATVVIDNRPGAMGSIGAAEAARSPADGYTFLFTLADPLVSATVMIKSLPYKPATAFSPITKVAVGIGPMLVARPGLKANNFSELVALAKTGTPLSYGSWGPGTTPVQIMESAARQAGVQFREVPYRGSPPALQDLLGDSIDTTFLAPFVAAPLIAEGRIKALATVGTKRPASLPGVQTFPEAGFSSFVFTNCLWVGLLAPAGTDEAIQRRVGDSVRKAVHGDEFGKYLTSISFDPVGNSAAEFRQDIDKEAQVIPALLRELGLQPQ